MQSSALAWRTPWTEEPGGLQPMRSQKESDMTEWLTHNTPLKYQTDPEVASSQVQTSRV